MSYKEGVIKTIIAYNDRSGSSLIAIKRHMKDALPGDKKWSNSAFLRALKSAISKGELTKIKGSYKLSAACKKKFVKAGKKTMVLKAKVIPKKKLPSKKKNISKATNTLSTKNEEKRVLDLKSKELEPGQGWTNGAIQPMMYSNNGHMELYQSSRRLIQTSTSWSRTGKGDPNDKVGIASRGSNITTCPIQESKLVKSLICQLSEKFYSFGWQPGTGGGMSIRIGEGTDISPYKVFSTPSGLQKDDMIGEDIFEMDIEGNILEPPKTPGLKLSSMTSLWFIVYKLRPRANCVIHTHSMNAQLATMLDSTETSDVFKISHLEMIKGVGHHAYNDVLEVPIIDNQLSENQLGPDMEKAITKYPKCNAVLVRRHGLYVWGDSWEQAKTQLESFDYLFESAVKMKSMGVDLCAKK